MDRFFYELNFSDNTSVIACIVGDMGPLPAAQATNRLLACASVKLIAVLGLAGSLDSDVLLGDVVIAGEVNEFLAKSKAVQSSDGYEFKFSGRHTRMDYSLREVVDHFDVHGGDPFRAWSDATTVEYKKLNPNSDLCNCPAKLHVGSMASGDIVGAAKAFTKELLEIDRKFLALDMEAAGVAKAAADRLHPVKVLIVRGISDFADERKAEFDQQGKGAWRQMCVRNATTFFQSLMAWQAFRDCIGVSTENDPSLDSNSMHPTQLAQHMHNIIGGPWAAGVLLGLHSRIPVVGQDSSSLPIADARIRISQVAELMNSIDECETSIEQQEDSESIILKLSEALKQYCNSLEPANIEMLRQFDKVVLSIIDDDFDDGANEIDEAIVQINRLIDDERFNEAELFLEGFDWGKPEIRVLVADTFFGTKDFQRTYDLLRNCNQDTLCRREIEHLITACFECGIPAESRTLLDFHSTRFKDPAAMLFQSQIVIRYPTSD